MPPSLIPAEQGLLPAVADRLSSGYLVALPTETVYGLAADAENPSAVRAVFAAKGRPADHPLIVHLADATQATRYVQSWPLPAQLLAARFWPGPLTMVLPASPAVLPEVTGGQSTVALRVPDHPFTRAVIKALGRGIVAPSANRFGRISPTTAAHVVDEFPNETLWVVDGGTTPVGVESTIVDLSRLDSAGLVILRPGAIGAAEIAAALAAGGAAYPVVGAPGVASAATPRVPGALAAHYAPVTPLLLWQEPDYRRWLDEAGRTADAVPTHAVWFPRHWPAASNETVRIDQPTEPTILAQQLYAVLRALDASGAAELWVALPEGEGALLAAVRDRLSRAAHRELALIGSVS